MVDGRKGCLSPFTIKKILILQHPQPEPNQLPGPPLMISVWAAVLLGFLYAVKGK